MNVNRDTASLQYTVDNVCSWLTVFCMCLDTHQVDKASQAILVVKELKHSSERKANGEEHCGMTAARGMRTLQQPQSVTHHLR